MDDTALVAVVQRAQQGQDALLRLRLAEGPRGDDRVEQLAASHVVLHQVVVVRVVPEVPQADDVGVAAQLVQNRRFFLCVK